MFIIIADLQNSPGLDVPAPDDISCSFNGAIDSDHSNPTIRCPNNRREILPGQYYHADAPGSPDKTHLYGRGRYTPCPASLQLR